MSMHRDEALPGTGCAARYPEASLTLACGVHRCRVEEISPGAARVRAEHEVPEGAEVMLAIPGYGRVPAEVVRLKDGAIGLLFLHDREAQEAMRDWLSAPVH